MSKKYIRCKYCGSEIKIKDSIRLKHNLGLEHALCTIFGKKYHGDASLFEDPKYVKQALNDWIKKVRKRITELTNYDERLRLVTSIQLELLKKELKNFPKENNEWMIITHFIYLINYLLGYDLCDGTINRHVIYFQDRGQEWKEQQKMGKRRWEDISWTYKNVRNYRRDIIKRLREKGLNYYQISEIMDKSESTIKRISKNK